MKLSSDSFEFQRNIKEKNLFKEEQFWKEVSDKRTFLRRDGGRVVDTVDLGRVVRNVGEDLAPAARVRFPAAEGLRSENAGTNEKWLSYSGCSTAGTVVEH